MFSHVCICLLQHLLECLYSIFERSRKSDLWSPDSTSHQLHPEQTSWWTLNLQMKVSQLSVWEKVQENWSSSFQWVLTQMSPWEHVVHTSWCAYNYMGSSCWELGNFIADICAANASMAASLHVVTQRHNNLLDLQRGDKGKQVVQYKEFKVMEE